MPVFLFWKIALPESQSKEYIWYKLHFLMQKCILRWFQKHLTLYNFLFWYQSWWSYRTGPAVYKSDASKNVLELYCLHFSNYILYGVLLVNLTEIASKDKPKQTKKFRIWKSGPINIDLRPLRMHDFTRHLSLLIHIRIRPFKFS